MNGAAIEFVRSSRDYYGQYHHHKELMAYGATVLYVTAASWLTFTNQDPLGAGAQRLPRLLLFSLLALTALLFVWWQLRQRRFAADMVEACTRILARSLNQQDAANVPTDTRLYNGLQLPHFLVDELVVVAESRRFFRGTGTPEVLTVAVVVIWTILPAWRLFG